MKKQVRHIRVKGEPYVWQAKSHEDESGIPYTKVKIWKNKEIIFEESFKYELAVTPQMIANRINKQNATV